jgi:peptide/nickel transport system substrate-binding protein
VQPALLESVQNNPDLQIASQVSSYTHVIRMRADKEPFDNVALRNAIKACQDRQQILDTTMKGFGALGEDHHVAPIHPSYCPKDIPTQDIDKAKALLAEAGYPDGIELNMAVLNGEPVITIAQLLQQQCAPAGININLDMMPASMYWDQWMEVDFGITSWTHRPLAIMVLELAYRTGVPWNETHWSNERFDELLTEAQGKVDIEERREIMCEIETIMQEEGPVALPRWGSFLWGHHKRVKNYRGAPHDHVMLDNVWLDDEE